MFLFFKAHYSTGRVAASFTSTAMVPVLEHEAAILEENEIRYERIKKKGFYNSYLKKKRFSLISLIS